MIKLRHNEIRIVAKYIYDNYDGDKVKLEDYLVDSLEAFSRELNEIYYTDDLLEFLIEGVGYKKLVLLLDEIIDYEIKHTHTSKILLYNELGYEVIEATPFGRKISSGHRGQLLRLLNQWELLEDDKVKGDRYEKFCTLFFNDIGFKTITTRSSNDGGIDIVGSLELPFQESVLNNLLGKNGIHIIAQVKYRAGAVDTPVIRRLIGDSLFYRFQMESVRLTDEHVVVLNNHPAYLCVISHKGFTKTAVEFARTKGVIILDSSRMVDILCSMGKWDKLDSVKYLESFAV